MNAKETADFWACACVKRDKAGRMAAIKLHSPRQKRCRVCGCKKPPAPKEESPNA